jgi:hypothetical protein
MKAFLDSKLLENKIPESSDQVTMFKEMRGYCREVVNGTTPGRTGRNSAGPIRAQATVL